MTSMIEQLNYSTLNDLTQVIFHNSSSAHFFSFGFHRVSVSLSLVFHLGPLALVHSFPLPFSLFALLSSLLGQYQNIIEYIMQTARDTHFICSRNSIRVFIVETRQQITYDFQVLHEYLNYHVYTEEHIIASTAHRQPEQKHNVYTRFFLFF